MSATTAEGTMPQIKKGAWSRTKARIAKTAKAAVRVAKTATKKTVNGVARVVGAVTGTVLTAARVLIKVVISAVVAVAALILMLAAAVVITAAVLLLTLVAYIDRYIIGTLIYLAKHGLINDVNYPEFLSNRVAKSDATWQAASDKISDWAKTADKVEQTVDTVTDTVAETVEPGDIVVEDKQDAPLWTSPGVRPKPSEAAVDADGMPIPYPLTPREEAVLANANFESIKNVVSAMRSTGGVDFDWTVHEDGYLEVYDLTKIDDQVFDMDTTSVVDNDDQRNYLLAFLSSIAGNANRPKQRGYAQGRYEALTIFLGTAEEPNVGVLEHPDKHFARVWMEYKSQQDKFPHNTMLKGFHDQVEEIKASAAVL